MRWGSILRNSNLAGADQAAYAFHDWLKDMIARNRPYDEFVRGIVAAAGEWQDAPAVNWYWQIRDDQLHQVTPTRPRCSSACACNVPAATTIRTSAGARTTTTAWPASSPAWAARASASRRPITPPRPSPPARRTR